MRQPPITTSAATGEFLHDLLLDPARHDPGRPAVVEPAGPGTSGITTYGELRTLTAAYARDLNALGLQVGSRVVLEAETSARSIALLLACSHTGLTFVPVSPGTPQERLLSVLEAARPALHIQATTGERTGLPAHLGTARFGDAGLTLLTDGPRAPRRRATPCVTDPAYVIFTSGTTGRPKGVVMSHRAVTAFYRGMLSYQLAGAEDRIASTSPLQFDFSLLNIGLALGSGAAVVPLPPDLVRWPRRFLRALHETGATQVNGVPSLWRQVLRFEPDRLAALTELRSILFCGEEFPLPELRRMRELRPRTRIVNCYGATESMACTFKEVPDPLPDDAEGLSVGVAHPGAELLLVDEHGEVVEGPGVPGEMHLRSPALFSGYWDDARATREALVPDPVCPQSGQLVLRTGDLAVRDSNGEYFYRGRTDSQVQINGNRVELGEVERRLLEFPGVTSVAALPLPGPGGGTLLAAFVVATVPPAGTDGASAHPSDDLAGRLREFCARSLPSYMVPSEVRFLGVLPITDNGKVDRAALAAGTAQPPHPAPVGSV